MQILLHEIRLFFIALQFLTRVRVPQWVGFEPDWLNQSVRYFPVVGAFVGLCGAAVLVASAQVLPPSVAALCSVAFTVWLTGAFHEDGLADTFDALGGHVSKDKALEIMKDSRIGTYGASALMLSLALRAALYAALLPMGAAVALVALISAHTFARAAAVVMMAMLPYAGDAAHAKAKPLATHVSAALAMQALAFSMAIVCALLWWAQLSELSLWSSIAPTLLLVLLLMRRWLHNRIGGYTGDTLGATEQLCEMAVLMCFAAWAQT